MKSLKGILLIMILLTISGLLWYSATPLKTINTYEQLSYVLGGLAITGFSLTFLLCVRSNWLDRLFNGLEKVYFHHKVLAVFSLVLVFLHAQVREFGKDEEHRKFPRGERPEGESLAHFAGELGEIAQNGFLLLIIIAFFAKFLKYEHWRYIHRLMVIPFAIGLFHTYFTDVYNLFALTPVSIFTAIISLIGLVSAIYMLFLYQSVQFKHKGTITAITKQGDSAVELEITLDKPLRYQDGQYIFLKVFQDVLEKAPHPFSIAGGDGQKIYVTIKALGDFTTKLTNTIQVNTSVTVDGPYGHMHFEQGANQQVWIAGGVGITPFLAYLKNKQLEKDVQLFYSYRGQNNALYKQFLEEYAACNEHLTVHFIDTTAAKRLHINDYPIQKNASIFMCGPTKMVKSCLKQLKHSHTSTDITFEAFKFK